MSPISTRMSTWYSRLASFSVQDLFSRKREPGPPRTVFVNENLPSDYLDHKGRVQKAHRYTSNQVITSKYTIITFIPRNLLEQFRRVANVFFLALAVLQFFPKFSTISPGVVILPLAIIIALTAAKDGYEDFQRHQADRKVNYSTISVLVGGNWTNPNAMEGKSKTFIRRMIPDRKSRKLRKVASPTNTLVGSKGVIDKPTPSSEEVPVPYDAQVEYDEPRWETTLWEDVRVGDFVMIKDNESFPADILICATSDDENVAFVETKNLDGETNLKSRNAIPALTHLRTAAACADVANSFRVNCDRPENNMYRINGTVAVQDERSPLDIQTTLLRGTVLRNTTWAIGVVLFTGEDTKIVMNSGGTPSKRSRVERQMNPQVLINLLILAILATVCAIADTSLEKEYYPLGAPWLYGDDQSDDNPRINGLITWAFAILTFQDIVPISLYISLEVVRTLQSAFIYFDKDIWYEKTNKATIARSWNLSDDLGQIEYIFSDKTGTLTQNSMIFRQCSIGGKAYKGDPEVLKDDDEPLEKTVDSIASGQTSTMSGSGAKEPVIHFHDSILAADIEESVSETPNPDFATHARALNGFFSVLALCHTALASVDPLTGTIQYKAQSPDESALVQAAADCGFVFLGRDKETMSVRTPSSPDVEKYELLNILEFTSARKRMSVVLRKLDGEDGRIFLLTKGADNVIFERLKPGSEDLKNVTERQLSEFANDGLRTLTLAYKVITEEEYMSWSERYHDATLAMDDRENKIDEVSEELENDLRLLGATAIEDRLQDGVPETIADLKRAGIKIWVATGDKLETAIAIGRTTNLISHDSNIIIVRGGTHTPVDKQMLRAIEQFFPEDVESEALPRASTDSRSHGLHRVNTGVSSIVGAENGDRPGGFVLVVDGAALLHAFENEDNKKILLRLGTLCEGVICCRVSPLQKALIVKLVKDGLHAMTLAIGDGANDVSMIQAADVGVGISGEEGLQAVNSSDYAIGQFRFLKKLILVHGHWSYARNGIMILNFFYKNIVSTGILWWFQIYCGWSASFAFDYTYILFWNSLWSLAPVVGIGLFDRIVDYHILMDLPELYHYGREQYWFNWKDFYVFMLDATYQSVVIFFFIMFGYMSTSSRTDGFDTTQWEWSTTMAISGVMVVDIFTGMCATAWTAWLFFAVFVGIVLVWGYSIIYSIIAPGYAVTHLFGNYYFLFTSAYFWLSLPLTILLALAPRYLFKGFKFGFFPTDIDIVRWIRKTDPYRDLAHDSQAHQGIGLSVMKRQRSRLSRQGSSSYQASMAASRRTSRANSVMTIEDPLARPTRPSVDLRCVSRTDMATGLVSTDRGFDFATEERGVAMRRMQSNLSERRVASSRHLVLPRESGSDRKTSKGKEALHLFSLRRKRKGSAEEKRGSTAEKANK